MQTLSGLRVLRIGDSLAAAYCAKLLSGFGADCRSLPAHDETTTPEFGEDVRHWFGLNEGAEAFDWSSPEVGTRIHARLAETDVLIDARPQSDTDPYGLDAESLASRHPHLVTCRITPFGMTGPYRGHAAEDITLYAMSGLMHSTGDADREPLNARPRVCQVSAGINAYIACLICLLRRQHDGGGDFIDLSMQEASMQNYETLIADFLNVGRVARRNGDEHGMVPWTTYRCADGEALIACGPVRKWRQAEDLFAGTGLMDDRFAEAADRIAGRAEFQSLMRDWAASRSKETTFLEGQARGLAWSYVATLTEALDLNPQHAARHFFVSERCADGLERRFPGAPFLGTASHWRIGSEAPGERPWRRENAGAQTQAEASRAPLAGVRVLDFSHDWAGPHAARILADFGAEVIKVEYPLRLDSMRGGYADKINSFPRFWQLHRNKHSLTLDLRQPEQFELCRTLVAESDLIIENSRPGVMDKLGLGYEAVRAINPDIIMLSMSAFGATGPYAGFAGYGGTIEALSGLQSLTGYAEDEPRRRVREMDAVNGMFGASAALTALLHRSLSGAGQWIDLSETETCCWLMGEFLGGASADGGNPAIIGNRHETHAPQGCYPCAGEDRWLTISITSDTLWKRLARIIGDEELASDPGYASATLRRQRHDEIDALILRWSRTLDMFAAMQILQSAGIPAGAVLDTRNLAESPHLAARDWFESVDEVRLPGFPFRLRRGGARLRWKGPDLGRDNLWAEESFGLPRIEHKLSAGDIGTAYTSI